MLFLFDMLLLNGSCDANKQVPWRYIQPIRLAQHTVGNHGQLFLDSGLKSQIADGPEVAVQFLIVTEFVEGWLLWFISWDTVMVYVIWMTMNITALKSYSCIFHERSDNCIILNLTQGRYFYKKPTFKNVWENTWKIKLSWNRVIRYAVVTHASTEVWVILSWNAVKCSMCKILVNMQTFYIVKIFNNLRIFGVSSHCDMWIFYYCIIMHVIIM